VRTGGGLGSIGTWSMSVLHFHLFHCDGDCGR
jgi:hypothetical protein